MAAVELLTGSQVARRFGVNPGTVTRWRAKGLPSKEVARGVFLYHPTQVDRWGRSLGYEPRVPSGASGR